MIPAAGKSTGPPAQRGQHVAGETFWGRQAIWVQAQMMHLGPGPNDASQQKKHIPWTPIRNIFQHGYAQANVQLEPSRAEPGWANLGRACVGAPLEKH
jgi:hypothetical protein